MNSFKKLDEPPGVLGISFEDWRMFLLVVCFTIMVFNLTRKLIELPSWTFWGSLVFAVISFFLVKRSNKQNIPYFFQSKLSWLLMKKNLVVTHTKLFHYDQPHEKAGQK